MNPFRHAVRNLTTLTEELWIQTEFYKRAHCGNVEPANLEPRTQAAVHVKDVRESAHNLFSPIYNVPDSTETSYQTPFNLSG